MSIGAVLNLAAIAIPLGLIAFGLWARRSEGNPDRPGIRTHATFRGAAPYILPAEFVQLRSAMFEDVLGVGLLQTLAPLLVSQGLEVVDAPDASEFGCEQCVRLGPDSAHLVVGLTPEGEGQLWLDAQGGGPASPEFPARVDAALKALPGLTDIVWHYRERSGSADSGASSVPLDAMPS